MNHQSPLLNLGAKEHIVTEVSHGVTLDTVVYITSLGISGALLFLLVYFVITLSDLECDYLNAQECCDRLNMWVMPKCISHAVLCIILSITGHFHLSLASVPLLMYCLYEYKKVPYGNIGVFDPTDILKHDFLKARMRDAIIGILYYLTVFFLYLYCLLTHLLRTTQIVKPSYNDDLGV